METQLLSIVSRNRFESPSIPSETPALCALPFFSVFFVLLCDWLVQSVMWTLGHPVQLQASPSFAAQSDCRAAAGGSICWVFVSVFCFLTCFCAFVAVAVVVKGRFVHLHECVNLPAVAPWCREVLLLWAVFRLRARKLHQSRDSPTTVFFNHWAAKVIQFHFIGLKKQCCIPLWSDCAFKRMWGYQLCVHLNRPRCHTK